MEYSGGPGVGLLRELEARMLKGVREWVPTISQSRARYLPAEEVLTSGSLRVLDVPFVKGNGVFSIGMRLAVVAMVEEGMEGGARRDAPGRVEM